MKRIKKILLTCIAGAITISTINFNVFANDNHYTAITEKQAIDVATNFVISRAHSDTVNETFPIPFKIIKDKTIYNLDDNITAYKFNVLDVNGKNNGYVITGAQMDVAPVIEYGCSNESSFLDKAIDNIVTASGESTKIYFDGGMDYYIEKATTANNNIKLYDVQSAKQINKSKSDLKASRPSIKTNYDNKFSEKWNNALGMTSNPPSNTYISNPLDYESGYTGYTMKYIAGATANIYRLMSSFSGYTNHCGPTAATNLCILNYTLNNKTALKNSSWDNTFSNIYSLSGCTASNGTYDTNLRNAIVTYGKNRGYSSTSATLTNNPSESSMRSSINSNIPQILLVNGHGYYGDHFVLTVGCEKYNYSSGSSTYFRVIDGWSTSSRYIFFDSSYMASTITANFS